MKTITQAKFIERSNIAPELIKAVIRQIGGWDSFKESALDISNHGIDEGFNGFLYYRDTESFAKRNLSEINELLSFQAQEFGYVSTFAMIRGFACLVGENIGDTSIWNALCRGLNPVEGPNILNALAWYAGEEVARSYCDQSEQS